MRFEKVCKALWMSSVVLAANPAWGQDAPPAAQAAEADGIKDIVVTAQRRSENLQKVAIPVTAVSGKDLIAQGVTTPTGLTTVVPALQVAPAAGPFTLFYLRGVGNFNGNALSDPAIAFNFDGVYIGRPSSTSGFFYDLDRVEVLKGPQGTLYGRNATGGAINVISTRPVLGQTSAEATVEVGNYNAVRADAAINVPTSANSALRLAGSYVRHDGYMRDGTDDQNDLAGRASFRWEPSSDLTVNIVADGLRQRGEGTGGTPVEPGIKDRDGFLSPQGQAFVGSQPDFLLGQPMTPFTVKPYLHNNYWGISATVDWRTPIGTVTVVPAYRTASLDYTSEAPGFYLWQKEKDYQGSLEMRLASPDSQPLRYLLGAFVYSEINSVPYDFIWQQANVNLDSYRQHDSNEAVFGRLTYALADTVRIGAGARYTDEVKHLGGSLLGDVRACQFASCPGAQPLPYSLTLAEPNFNPFAGGGAITIPVAVDDSSTSGQRAHFSKFTYRFNAEWDVSPRNLLYATYETGFKSGGFFFTSDNGTYQPETINAYTVGSKNRFLDNRVQLNVELFYWRYHNQQISHLVLDSAGQAVFATQNVGQATYKGAEVDTRIKLSRTTEINADIQYLDARYTSYVYLTPNTNGGISNGTGCGGGVAAATYTIDCSGSRPPYAPDWTINLGAQQTVPVATGRLVGDVRAHWQSRTLTGLEFTPAEYQKPWWNLDAQIAFTTGDDRLTLAVYGQNLLNTTTVANSFAVPFTTFTAASLTPPRTYGLRGTVKF
jgi:iron complex outermembrane receptor protein